MTKRTVQNKKKNNNVTTNSKHKIPSLSKHKIPSLLIAVSIAIITFFVFLPSLSNDFIMDWDDQAYIHNNQLITDLSPVGITKIFSNYVFGNFNPITILSFAIDYHFFRHQPYGYHFVNVLLHSIVCITLFYFIFRLTNNQLASTIATLLFALNPMHTESIAWVTGRKDLLFGLFFFLALIFYIKYITILLSRKEQSKSRGYLILSVTFLFFLLSCLSKAVAVTTPAVMFGIDYCLKRKLTARTVIEKVPFVIVSIVLGLVAIDAQKSMGAVKELTLYNITDRIFLLGYSIFFYIHKYIIPIELSAVYPYPLKQDGILPSIVIASPFILIILFAALVYFGRKQRLLFFSGFLFIFCIAPVIQLIPVGATYTADRFVYVPSAGLCLFGGIFFARGFDIKKIKIIIAALLICVLSFYSYVSYNRAKVWKNTFTLFSQVLEVYPTCDLAYFNIGNFYMKKKEYSNSIELYKAALSYNVNYADAMINLGNCYNETALYDSSITVLSKAIVLNQDNADAYNNLGVAYYHKGIFDKAAAMYKKALQISPVYHGAYNNLGVINGMNGNYVQAIGLFTKAIELKKDFTDPYKNMGLAYTKMNNQEKAAEYYRAAIALGDKASEEMLRNLESTK
ncbi:MAG: hypothetical protein HW421_2892 [Ignavibacteria bacterium]|nr:hypothetical protein [Ignavibacteria bacterium]